MEINSSRLSRTQELITSKVQCPYTGRVKAVMWVAITWVTSIKKQINDSHKGHSRIYICSFEYFWASISFLHKSVMLRKPVCTETKERDCTTGEKKKCGQSTSPLIKGFPVLGKGTRTTNSYGCLSAQGQRAIHFTPASEQWFQKSLCCQRDHLLGYGNTHLHEEKSTSGPQRGIHAGGGKRYMKICVERNCLQCSPTRLSLCLMCLELHPNPLFVKKAV